MTFLAITYVPDGIAIAADSRLTRNLNYANGLSEKYIMTDNQDKIFILANGKYGICFHGTNHEGKISTTKLLSDFELECINDKDDIQEVADKLKKYLLNKYPFRETEFYLVGYSEDEPFVFLVNRRLIERINVLDRNEVYFGSYWIGERILVSAIKGLIDQGIFDFELMTVLDAAEMSEFIVSTAVNFQKLQDVFAECGGPIDVLLITKEYTKFLKYKMNLR
ncbi:hypothetical protein [Metabacillus niabensis]|uniref:Uncharacterized protein n=1 Tax=Metabacillus niabensis TaxID=324854 RepID=A0ABT9Z7N6_9BACI|nr:hypothetical protein [Metabacillus niabensis]MDQ0228242.1 hypothetical protein [Metabacillus niabensis]PAD67058.1 hypothetical protein CHH83_20695 [Bacillus sp. 7586-K]